MKAVGRGNSGKGHLAGSWWNGLGAALCNRRSTPTAPAGMGVLAQGSRSKVAGDGHAKCRSFFGNDDRFPRRKTKARSRMRAGP